MLLVPYLKRLWPRIIRTPSRVALPLGALAMLAGCSMVSLGYNRLPDLGLLWVNRQLSLTELQTAQVRTDMNDLLAWHRRTQLPATAELLRRWQNMAAADVSADQACREFTEVRRLLDTITQQALPAMARWASSATPNQLAEIQRTQMKGNETFRETYSTPTRGWFATANVNPNTVAAADVTASPLNLLAKNGLAKRLDSMSDRYSQLYGTLNESQVGALREKLQNSVFEPRRTLAERERRQAELLSILRSIQTPGEQAEADRTLRPQALLQGWVKGFTASPTPGYDTYAAKLVRDGCEQFAALHNSTTAEQRRHSIRTLQTYETDLRALAQQKN